MSKEEKFGWIVTIAVFVMCFFAYFVYGFLENCVFEWPVRWDVGTCWHEQVQPAKDKAAEKAIQFVP